MFNPATNWRALWKSDHCVMRGAETDLTHSELRNFLPSSVLKSRLPALDPVLTTIPTSSRPPATPNQAQAEAAAGCRGNCHFRPRKTPPQALDAPDARAETADRLWRELVRGQAARADRWPCSLSVPHDTLQPSWTSPTPCAPPLPTLAHAIVWGANNWMERYHDRMPVILPPERFASLPGQLAGRRLTGMRAGGDAAEWPVPRRANRTGEGDDDPTIILGGVARGAARGSKGGANNYERLHTFSLADRSFG